MSSSKVSTPISIHQRLQHGLVTLFSSPRTRWCIAIAIIILLAPLSRLPLSFDDLVQYHIVKGSLDWPGQQHWALGLYTFFDGTIERGHAMVAALGFPWWTDLSIKVNFLRPLTAFTSWFDLTVWPQHTALMHLHSIAWYLLLCSAVYLLYTRLVSLRWVAVLATFIYVFDYSHAFPIGWLANRNVLLAAVFAVFCLYSHHRWRESCANQAAVWHWRLLACLALLASLLSAEAGLASCGYLGAYALCLERGPLFRRLLNLWPYVLISVAWLVAYKALGYGSANTTYYLSTDDPVAALTTVLSRFPVLTFIQLSGIAPWAYLHELVSPDLPAVAWISAVLLLILWLVWPIIRDDRNARFWLLGLVLSTFPSSGSIPQERLLVLTDIGGAIFIAHVLCAWATRLQSFVQPRRLLLTLAAFWLIGMHMIYNPLQYLTASVLMLNANLSTLQDSQLLPPLERPDQQYVFVNPPMPIMLAHSLLGTRHLGKDIPAINYSLATHNGRLDMQRLDERSLRITMPDGFVPDHPTGRYYLLFRSLDNPLQVGEQFDYGGIHFTVEAVNDLGFITQARYDFDRSLDDPRWRWIYWNQDVSRLQPFTPPAPGDSISLLQNAKDK